MGIEIMLRARNYKKKENIIMICKNKGNKLNNIH